MSRALSIGLESSTGISFSREKEERDLLGGCTTVGCGKVEDMQYALQTDRLRPRQRDFFFGFTTGEIEKMETSFLELGPEETTTKKFCSKLALSFNRSSGRAGKPLLKWSQVQSWFVDRQEEWNKKHIDGPVKDVSPSSNGKADSSNVKEYLSNGKEDSEVPRVAGQKNQGLMNLEFEAKSSKDGAWYDVDLILAHRLVSGEAEVRVRFIGFGPEEDEWVNIKSVRERSIPLESSECNRLKAGDFVLCFQEKRDQAIYYDARIKEIQRKVHDIRGCRCLFLVRYDHDNFEEKVKLRRLCRRPTW